MFAWGGQKNLKKDIRDELPKNFFQRWELNYGMANGQKVSDLPKSPSNDYKFNKDETYILYSINGGSIVGKWEYNGTENCIYTRRDDGQFNGKIIEMKVDSFILILYGEDITDTPFENLRFYYKPKSE